jgi:hypothetical protein
MFQQKWLFVFVLLILANMSFAQQLVLGKNPYAMNKSAVLELNADNQGLLLSRITDTTSINTLNPPDGMVIYFVPTRRLLVRTNGYWSALAPTNSTISLATGTTGTDVNVSGSPVALGGTVTLNLPSAAASARGLLTSADWNTFNNKQAALSFGNLTSATGGVTISGGTGAVIGAGVGINLQNATTSQNGLLTSADWNTFNNKVSTTRTITTTAPLSGGGDLSADRTLSMTQANTTTNGWLSSTDWNTFNSKQTSGNYLTALTGDVTATGPGAVAATIANNAVTLSKFQQVATGTILGRSSALTGNIEVLTTLPASTLPAYTGDVTKAAGGTVTTIANNIISNTKFRQSAALSVVGNATNATANVADITAANDGEVLRRSGTTLGFGQVATAGITNSAVTYAKIQNVSSSNRLLGRVTAGAGVMEEITIGSGLSLSGTTLSANAISGTSNYISKFAASGSALMNSQMFDDGTNVGIGTTAPTSKLHVMGTNPLTLTGVQQGTFTSADSVLIISSGVIRKVPNTAINAAGNFWSITGNSGHTGSNYFIGTIDAQPLFIKTAGTTRMFIQGSGVSTAGYVGIGNASPSQQLDVTGNIEFSGALMPGASAGTSGQLLRSNGTGTAPSWITPAYVSSVGLSMPSIFSVSGSPVTSTGTLTAALNTQTANLVFASPSSGPAAVPAFRALVKADLPATVVHTDQANTYTAGMKQGFRSSSTTAGSNWSGIATDPTVLVNGDLWHNTTASRLKFQSGSTVFTLATTADIPTNTNQLTNGAGFITNANVVFSNQANTYTAGMKQTFRSNTTNAGVSFGGALTADPATLAAGDLWYRSDLGKLKYYNGTTSRIIATEGSIEGTLNYVPKFTPDGSTLGNSQVFDNGTNVGINTASPNSTLTVNGSLTVSYKIVSADYTILSTDYVTINTGAAVTWTLPAATSCAGRVYRLINQGSGAITLTQTVRTDATTTTINLGNTAGSNTFEILSDGTEWRQIK